MNRNYYISQNLTNNSVSNYIAINPNSINDIINHSADSVVCDCLEYLTVDQIDQYLHILLDKIKPDGIITFIILDIKSQCKKLLDGEIDPTELLSLIKSYNMLILPEKIYTQIDSNTFTPLQINKENNQILITFKRVAV